MANNAKIKEWARDKNQIWNNLRKLWPEDEAEGMAGKRFVKNHSVKF